MKLEVRVGQPLTWLGPAWAALCGAVASRGLTFSGQNLLVLFVVLFLTSALWSTLWHLITETSWVASSHQSVEGDPAISTVLPYTVPGSPGYRVFHRVGRKMAWWQTALWPRQGATLASFGVILPLTVVLSIILGRRVIILTVAALAIMVLALLRARRHTVPPLSLRAVLDMGLAWLAGHTAFAPLTLWSLLLAALYAVVYHSCLKLAADGGKRGLTLSAMSQAAVIAVLVFLRQPIVAGVVGLLLLPQMLLQQFLDQGQVELWYLRRTGPFVMAGMLLAELAAR